MIAATVKERLHKPGQDYDHSNLPLAVDQTIIEKNKDKAKDMSNDIPKIFI